jgi:hypothetical protein
MVLATVKWNGPASREAGLAAIRPLLIGRQSDIELMAVPELNIRSETFPSSFWLQKVD